MAQPKIHINEDETRAYVCYLNKAKQKLTVVFSYDKNARMDIEERSNGSTLTFYAGVMLRADLFIQSKNKGLLKNKYGEPELLESLPEWIVRDYYDNNTGAVTREVDNVVDLHTNLENTNFYAHSYFNELTDLIQRAQKDVLAFYPKYLEQKRLQSEKLAEQRFKAYNPTNRVIARQKAIKFLSKEER